MKIAIFTMVREENVRLPVWVNYYKQQGFDKVEVLEDTNTEAFNHAYLVKKVSDNQCKLLNEGYTYVVFTEVDEFLMHKDYDKLGDYIRTLQKDTIQSIAYEVVQQDNEPDLKEYGLFLDNRNKYFKNILFGKPLISKVPLTWVWGFHSCKEYVAFDSSLVLLHTHYLDKNTCYNRIKQTSNWKLDKEAIETGSGIQNHNLNNAEKSFALRKQQAIFIIPEWIKERCKKYESINVR